ncbi:GTP cyclohydrolase II [Zavarzinia sp.]|uniref:GTP cyclohydrolase II n=1 Tax=Zavarzinia sp. TaxID=2027920 RepID=UPI003564E2E1
MSSPFGTSPASGLVIVDRAVSELRRGLDVVVNDGAGHSLRVSAAEYATPERLAGFIGAEARLLLTNRRAATLKLRPLVGDPVALPLSAGLDAATIASLADPTVDLDHPLRGPFSVLRRSPYAAEFAAVKLLKLARLLPAALVADVTGDEGLLSVPADAITDYDEAAARGLRIVSDARVPLADAEQARIIGFRPPDGGIEHLAILIGDPPRHLPVLGRLHSECFTGDLLGSLRCDCGEQLRGAIRTIAEAGGGVLLYLAQEGRGIGLMNKLKAYRLQDQGFDTVEANERLGFDPDERIFRPAAEMLRLMGFSAVRLLTNNPEKVEGLKACGIDVVERVPHAFPANNHNRFYLATKKAKSGHLL